MVVLQLLHLTVSVCHEFHYTWSLILTGKYSLTDTNEKKTQKNKSLILGHVSVTHWTGLDFFHYTLQQSCKKHCATQGWPLTTHFFKIDALTRKQVLQMGSSTVLEQVTQRPGNLENAPATAHRQCLNHPVIRLFNLCVFESNLTL